ncbi:MAG: HNH endonuclease [Desulfobacterales bacterium]|nr:HNH endonuclease [Desulfobacterales bacterium]
MRKELRIKVWEKYNKHCSYCGKTLAYKEMQVDHLFPKHLTHLLENNKLKKLLNIDISNINSFTNLMPSCRRCNYYKGGMQLEDYRKYMLSLHSRIKKDYKFKVAIDYKILIVSKFDGKFYFERTKDEWRFLFK